MKKRNWILCVTTAIVMALPALTPFEKTVAAGPPTVDIKIDNFKFYPTNAHREGGDKSHVDEWR